MKWAAPFCPPIVCFLFNRWEEKNFFMKWFMKLFF
jgi:hypothetical protein